MAVMAADLAWILIDKPHLLTGVCATIGVLFLGAAIINHFAPRPTEKTRVIAPVLPSVILVPEPDRLVLYNRGDEDLMIGGTKFSAGPSEMPKDVFILPKNGFYYFLTDKINTDTLGGKEIVPFEVYLLDQRRAHFTANFELLFVVKDKNVTIHTHNLGVVEGGW
jgi:hypothetical protein